MSKQYVGDQIEIESGTDTPEQVAAAMGATIEVDEVPAKETETEKKPPAKEEAEEAEPEVGETETEEEETEEAEAEAEEEKPKKKAPPKQVPYSRLKEEVAKRKALERQLAAKDDEPEAEVVAETRPQTFCGEPEPKIEDFLSKPDEYPDPYAAFTKKNGEWVRKETRAEMLYDQRKEAFVKRREEETKLFKASEKVTLEIRPDYSSVMKANASVEVHSEAQAFMEESTIGSYMLLYLAEHQDELSEINSMRKRARDAAMTELETTLLAEVKELRGEDAESEEEPEKKVTPPPKKKLISKAPLPANRLKPAGPGPKTLQELAGPPDKQGIDLDFNPEYERQTKARRRI